MRDVRRVLLVVAAATLVACGGSEEPAPETAAPASDQAPPDSGAGTPAGTDDLAKSLGELAGMVGGTAEPVNFRELQQLLPEIDGWDRDRPRGQTMTGPMKLSEASANYTRGGSTIEVKILDSSMNQALLAPYSMFLAAGFGTETSEGYSKSASFGGHPGWEQWNSENRSGSVNALVAKRFLVLLEGRDLDDTSALKDAIARIDTARLAALNTAAGS